MSDPVVLLSTGDVVGPAGGVTDNSMVLFSGTSGKLIKGNNAVVTSAGLALLDDVDAAAQRTTLGLKTGAVTDKTTSNTDPTVGRLTKVGDFGLGTDAVAVADANTIPASGVYRLEGSGSVNGPIPSNFFTLVNYRYGTTAGAQIATQLGGTTGQTWVRAQQSNVWCAWQEIALTDSPAFIGTPTAPTAAAGTNTTQLANTAFVKAAVDAAPRLGVGQTWQNVTSEIVNNTNRTNTTGRPIEVVVSGGRAGATSCEVYVDGLFLTLWGGTEPDELSITFTLPQGSYYKVVNPPQYYFTVVELR